MEWVVGLEISQGNLIMSNKKNMKIIYIYDIKSTNWAVLYIYDVFFSIFIYIFMIYTQTMPHFLHILSLFNTYCKYFVHSYYQLNQIFHILYFCYYYHNILEKIVFSWNRISVWYKHYKSHNIILFCQIRHCQIILLCIALTDSVN